MEKTQRDHITKNITRLIGCTKDKETWFDHLLKHSFLSIRTREIIINTEKDTDSIIREMYFECMKTPRYDLLIQSLKDCDNNNAAIILEEFYATSSSGTASNGTKNLIWFDIQQGTKNFKGREEELETIHNYWLKASRDNSLVFVGITGLGGIGKTELARNYANKFHNEVKGHCIWINAESSATFSDSFQNLTNHMKISLFDVFGKEKTLESLTSDVYERLSEIKYMVVFDNLESYEQDFLKLFVNYVKKLSPSKVKPFVLMTSRCQLVESNFGELVKQVDLEVLSETSALSFFKEALNISFENEEIVSDLKNLCELIDNLPLAMQQAASYIKERLNISDVSTEIKDYLISFNIESKKMLTHNSPICSKLDSSSKTIFFTWQITLDQLELISGVGSKVKMALNVLSFLNSDTISIIFLNNITNLISSSENHADSNNRDVDIFKILADYSMCQRQKIDGHIYVSVHRLVQLVTQIKLKDEQKWTEMLNTLLQIMDDICDGIAPFGNISQFRSLLNHTKNNTNKIVNHSKYFNLLKKLYNMYDTEGKYREGSEFIFLAANQMEELFGRQNKETLRMMACKGDTLYRLGEYEAAKHLLLDVSQNQQNLFCISCDATEKMCIETDLLTTKSTLASVYRKQCNYKEALNIFLQVLKVRQRVLGIEHPVTLSIKHNIADVYNSQGYYEKALKMYLKVLEIELRVLGIEHPHTLGTKHNIADIYNSLGHYEKALEIFLQVLEVKERVLGIEHPETLTTKNNTAHVLRNQGNFENAQKIYVEVLEARERVLGNEHPYTLTTKGNIALVYRKQDQLEEALKLNFEVLEVRQRVLGFKHTDTLITKHNIALVYMHQGNYKGALKILLEILQVQQCVIGMEHAETLTTRHNIADVYNKQGNYTMALKLSFEVLKVRQRVLGVKHPDTLLTGQCIADVYFKQGNYNEGMKMLLECFNLNKK